MITVTVTNRLEVGFLALIPRQVRQTIKDRLTFVNPKWEENKKHGFSNWQTPRELCYLQERGDRLLMRLGRFRLAGRALTPPGALKEGLRQKRVGLSKEGAINEQELNGV